MKIKSLILSALSALFVCAGSYAQSDYYVVHGADENVTHGTHYPIAVGIVGTHSAQQLVNNIASAPRCAAYFDKTDNVFEVKRG
jgi:hypothetical protein